jgi:hypothetical protein
MTKLGCLITFVITFVVVWAVVLFICRGGV